MFPLQTIQTVGPIAALACFFKEVAEPLSYIQMKKKSVVISTNGDLILVVVDLRRFCICLFCAF